MNTDTLYGVVDGGRARIGAGFGEAVLILPASGNGFFAIPRQDVLHGFGVDGRRVPVYDSRGAEVGYGVWDGDVFRIYAGDSVSPLTVSARDLRGAVRSLPKAGVVHQTARLP